MRKIINSKTKQYETVSIDEWVLDDKPTEESFNGITSDAVAKAIGNLGQPLQWKGPATVAQLNAGITGIQPGWTYTLTDDGTLTDGSIVVDVGDEVAWTEKGEWFQVGPSLVELKADVVQAKSDIADIQDVVPEEASDSNKLVTKDELDNVQESIQSGFTPKGEISVSDLNDLTTQSNGDQYILTDSGTITDGSVTVEAGDSVAWNSTDSVWYKVNQYALSKYGTDEIKNLPTTITAFRTGDVIPVDGPDGTAKMGKDDLLKEAAQGTLAGNVAEAFDPTRTSENPYKAGESVTYTDGKVYTFKVDHYGAWAAADVQLADEFWRNSFSRDQYQDGYIPTNGTLIGDLTANSDRITISVGCSAGQKFWVRGYSSGNAARLWCTIDDYGRIKRCAAAGADTRNDPLLITIEDGETGIVFNLFKNFLYFVTCSFPNGIKVVSDKLKTLNFNAVENSCNTAIPYKKIYAGKYVSATGVISDDLNFNVYEYDVNPATKIHIKTATGGGYVAFYDVDGVLVGTPIKEPNSVNSERVFYDVSVPSTAVIIRVTNRKNYNGVVQVPAVMSSDGFGIGKALELTKHIFAGKKILCIGDSITESGTWFNTLLEKTGALQVWNRGASGTTLASYTGSTDSMCDRADLDADDVESHHGGGFPSDANVDAVIAWGGTNDFGNVTKNVQFGGALERNKMAFVGGVFYLINKLKTKYPTKPVYICGILTAQKPGTGDWNRYSISGGVYTEKTNWTGKTISDYNAAIKKIASMTGVHFIDMELCGISPVNSTDYSNYFAVDGIHPNDAGGIRIGKFIAENLVFDS